VLDHVERRRFLVEPAGEDPAPALVRLLDVDLDERARQLLFFPRRGRFARTQPHDYILPPRGLAGVERDILDDAVALVEDAEHRDPLRHRRDAALAVGGRCNLPRGGRRRILLLASPPARHKRDCGKQGCRDGSHYYSGIHGS
jgi:hypothetical protein